MCEHRRLLRWYVFSSVIHSYQYVDLSFLCINLLWSIFVAIIYQPSDSVELELQMIGAGNWTRVLGRAANALNSWANSPAPGDSIKKKYCSYITQHRQEQIIRLRLHLERGVDRNWPGSAVLSSNSYSEGGLATPEPRWENSSDGLFQQSGKMCGEGQASWRTTTKVNLGHCQRRGPRWSQGRKHVRLHPEGHSKPKSNNQIPRDKCCGAHLKSWHSGSWDRRT